jgi:DNA-binding helix-turn-helix protein
MHKYRKNIQTCYNASRNFFIPLLFCIMKKQARKRTDAKLLELISKRMKELREERGYTQEYVVDHTGLNIPQHEAKITYPSLVSISVLCEFYNITVSDFFKSIHYPPTKD